jgi:acetamidase/formamidase
MPARWESSQAHNLATMRHHLGTTAVQYAFDRSLPPALTVGSGDEITFDVRGGGDGYFTKHSTAEDVARRPPVTGHALTGPVLVRDARAGDVLEIELLELRTWDWGYTFITKGMGLLSEELPGPYLKIWDLTSSTTARFMEGIEIPIEPFLGVVGLAPSEPGPHSTMPPRRVGGNLDLKHLTVGSKLWIPIEVDGALLTVGDSHAAQGDGEVCVTAIETGSTATLRATVRRDLELTSPEFRTAGPLTSRTNTGAWHATTGIAPDLMDATKAAVRAMIRYLERTQGLSAEEAYVLTSVAVDLKINEVVDRPNWVVSACLPLSIFRDDRAER